MKDMKCDNCGRAVDHIVGQYKKVRDTGSSVTYGEAIDLCADCNRRVTGGLGLELDKARVERMQNECDCPSYYAGMEAAPLADFCPVHGIGDES